MEVSPPEALERDFPWFWIHDHVLGLQRKCELHLRNYVCLPGDLSDGSEGKQCSTQRESQSSLGQPQDVVLLFLGQIVLATEAVNLSALSSVWKGKEYT